MQFVVISGSVRVKLKVTVSLDHTVRGIHEIYSNTNHEDKDEAAAVQF